jgi:hypothetical protein
MIWIFTCSTNNCENKKHPVYLADVSNPVLCSLCYVKFDAVETNEPAPTPE